MRQVWNYYWAANFLGSFVCWVFVSDNNWCKMKFCARVLLARQGYIVYRDVAHYFVVVSSPWGPLHSFMLSGKQEKKKKKDAVRLPCNYKKVAAMRPSHTANNSFSRLKIQDFILALTALIASVKELISMPKAAMVEWLHLFILAIMDTNMLSNYSCKILAVQASIWITETVMAWLHWCCTWATFSNIWC